MEQSRLPMIWGDEQDTTLIEFYRRLIHFRRQHPVLWRGDRKTVHLDEDDGTYAYIREDDQEAIIAAFNLSDGERCFEAAGHTFELAPWSGTLIEVKAG